MEIPTRSASKEENLATSSSSMVHDLKTLILSFHPVIAVETVEEDRVGFLLDQVAAELSATVFEWSVTEGLRKVPAGNMIHGTSQQSGPRYSTFISNCGGNILKRLTSTDSSRRRKASAEQRSSSR